MSKPPEPLAAGGGLRWCGRSDVGKVRKNNEDAFLGLVFDAQEANLLGKHGTASLARHDFVFAVSDGMGGAHAGEFASRVTVEKITRLLPRSYRQSALGLDAGFGDVLTELYDQIHRALLFLGGSYEECAGMGATLSLCWFTPHRMHFAHIGDSRIYYLGGEGGLRQISHDDTYVGWLFRNRQINEREARNHPRRNVLQRALGAGHQFVEPQIGSVAFSPGDTFLLCTDGVVDGLYDDRLHDLLHRSETVGAPEERAHRIVEAALENAGRDNTTAVVVEIA